MAQQYAYLPIGGGFLTDADGVLLMLQYPTLSDGSGSELIILIWLANKHRMICNLYKDI
jgi:hypothetical protein